MEWIKWFQQQSTEVRLLLSVSSVLLNAAFVWILWSGPRSENEPLAQGRKAEVGNMMEAESNGVTISGSNNTVSIGQTGGVTAGTYINQAVQPALKLVEEKDFENQDGTHTKVIRVAVASTHTPGRLLMKASGNGVLSGDVNPIDAGIVNFSGGVEHGGYKVAIQAPFGRYDVSVTTTVKTPINLDYAFERIAR